MELKQYQIVLVNLDPTIGSEMKKPRLCVIISPDEMNRHLQRLVIAPITSSSKSYPTRIKINYKATKGWIELHQIRTAGRQRIITILDSLMETDSSFVKAIIKETFVD